MPKYVCCFDEVRNIAESLAKAAEGYIEDLNTYSKGITADLADWDSPAKTSFTTVNASQVATSTTDAEYATKLSEYIKLAADKIEELEKDIASKMEI